MLYDGKWKKVKDNEEGKISKVEAQIWLGLRELLLNPKCAPYYEITEHRLSHLLKVSLYLVYKLCKFKYKQFLFPSVTEILARNRIRSNRTFDRS